MKKFETPEIEIIEMDVQDVVITSLREDEFPLA